MDELEFRQRAYTNPQDVDQEILDAARDNPAYQKILDQIQELDTGITSLVKSIEVPESLRDQLLSIPADADIDLTDRSAANSSFFQYYAIAASLLLAVGVTFSLTFNPGPSSAELAFGDDVLQHLYFEQAEIDAVNGGNIGTSTVSMPTVIQAMANAGTQLVSNDFMQSLAIRFAKPCEILPTYRSAHLIIEGSQGAVNIIVINNSPVSVEYTIRDDRFYGVVVPMGEGNMILVGERDEDLDQFKTLFSENVEFVI